MPYKWVSYNPNLKMLARKLRNKSTLPEVLLWNKLKRDQLLGYDFHRQKPVLNYIVDFYCPELKLVIEVDGADHMNKIELDKLRQKELEGIGLSVLRFTNRDIRKDMNGVIQSIINWIEENG